MIVLQFNYVHSAPRSPRNRPLAFSVDNIPEALLQLEGV